MIRNPPQATIITEIFFMARQKNSHLFIGFKERGKAHHAKHPKPLTSATSRDFCSSSKRPKDLHTSSSVIHLKTCCKKESRPSRTFCCMFLASTACLDANTTLSSLAEFVVGHTEVGFQRKLKSGLFSWVLSVRSSFIYYLNVGIYSVCTHTHTHKTYPGIVGKNQIYFYIF